MLPRRHRRRGARQFLRLAGKLHYVFGALLQVLESCPGFVSYRANAEAGEQLFLGVLPGGFLIQAGEDAGACCTDEELTPSDFVSVLSDLSELESLVQLCQPVGQDMLVTVVFWHCVHNGIHLCC